MIYVYYMLYVIWFFEVHFVPHPALSPQTPRCAPPPLPWHSAPGGPRRHPAGPPTWPALRRFRSPRNLQTKRRNEEKRRGKNLSSFEPKNTVLVYFSIVGERWWNVMKVKILYMPPLRIFVEILSICWKCKMKNDQKQRFIEILMKMKVSWSVSGTATHHWAIRTIGSSPAPNLHCDFTCFAVLVRLWITAEA